MEDEKSSINQKPLSDKHMPLFSADELFA